MRPPANVHPMYRRFSWVLLTLVFASAVYRAASQSLTTDEAFSHNLFLVGPISRLFNYYDASHHVLYNFLAKLSITLFGLSEFTLRLPSLLGALIYLTAVHRLLRRLFPDGPLLLLALALLTLNPHLMDFMSAARGYGLALGLFLWALDRALEFLDTPNPRLLYQIALALAFSVSANLTLAVPAASLATLLILAILADPRLAEGLPWRKRFWLAMDGFALPGAVTAFVILVLPLTKASRDHFYLGTKTAPEALQSVAEMSLFHHPLPGDLASLLPSSGFWYPLLEAAAAAVLAAALLACLAILWNLRRSAGFHALAPERRFLLFAGGSLALSALTLTGARHLLGVLYPMARTGLYFVLLFVLTAAALWSCVRPRRWISLAAGVPLAALAVLALAHFLAALQFDHYGEWRFDRSTREIVRQIRARQSRSPLPKVRVGASLAFEPTLNFYRRRYRLNWMEPVERSSPDGQFDYYVLLNGDAPLIQKRNLTVLYRDPFAGSCLAAFQSTPGHR